MRTTMKRIILIVATILLCASIFSWSATIAQNPHFTTIDFPGAALTTAQEVNENGDIVGFYRKQNPVTGTLMSPRGFLLSNGKFSTIDFPLAARTRAYGINNAGDIVGDYLLAGVNYGFLLRAGSNEFQTIQYSNGNFESVFLDAWGIDDQGNVTGGFDDSNGTTKAFVWRDGAFTRILEAPFDNTAATYTHGLNAQGEIVGCYWLEFAFDPRGTMHSLRVTPDGNYLTENFPASMGMSMHWRITDSSAIVGHYVDMADGVTRGYLYRNGDYEAIEFPGAVRTEAHGIAERQLFNGAGQILGARQLLIVGPYVDSSGVTHGYLFTRLIGVGLGEAQ